MSEEGSVFGDQDGVAQERGDLFQGTKAGVFRANLEGSDRQILLVGRVEEGGVHGAEVHPAEPFDPEIAFVQEPFQADRLGVGEIDEKVEGRREGPPGLETVQVSEEAGGEGAEEVGGGEADPL